ncbi:sensor histidine kinase [Paenibacillus abyssi]|uniref:histidine kinase n=1 Tax=Paenibacillus abyssi TaxID=1340531 RepID=A0A917CU66_9BACL|nr:HAMP domain-containing sensor histidine kinase [Paenibacillus abyssi]GGF97184.1 two-component sensor histidine kinase [Paenibacillus abyssi]
MSIRLRLTLWYSGLLAVTLLAFGVAIYLFVNINTYSEVKSRLQEESQRIQVFANLDYFDFIDLRKFRSDEIYIQLVNYNNEKITQSDNLFNASLKFPYPQLKTNPEAGFHHVSVEEYPFLIYQQPVLDRSTGETVALLQVGAYTSKENRLMEILRTILVFASLIAVFIAFTIGLFIARKALKPIENVIRATNQIENGSNLSVRIPREGPNDEMGRLTDTLNGMLSRLETTYNELDDAYRAQRRFVSDASHELRTPLTTIRGNIDLLEKMWQPKLEITGETPDAPHEVRLDAVKATMSLEAMRDISDEAKRMSRLVSDMLSLARADAGYEMEKSVIPLLPLVEEVARRAQLLPRTVDLRVADLSSLEGVEVKGNSDYLRQLLFIFIENAFKYTPKGYVELQAIRVSEQAGLIIKDTGIGMNEEEIPHIFERFYRADESRGKTSGTGLGLSIAKWIIDEHGGSIEVKTREGEGSTFVIWLPIAFSQQEDWGIMEATDRTVE